MWKLRDDRRVACLDPSLWSLVAQLQAQLVVNPMSFLQVDLPAFATQEDMDAPVAVADARLANLLDAGFNAGLLATTRFVMVGRTIEFQDAARPPDRHAPFITNRRRQLALASRPYSFRRMTSWSISRSSDRSATIFFSWNSHPRAAPAAASQAAACRRTSSSN